MKRKDDALNRHLLSSAPLKSGMVGRTKRSLLLLPAAFAALTTLVFVGCRPPSIHELDERELSDPTAVRAAAMKRADDVEGAIALYNATLMEHPEMARLHLALGFLYEEPKGDYVMALYHYQRYLELRPQTEKKALIARHMEHARASLAAEYGHGAHILHEQIKRLVSDKASLSALNSQLMESLKNSDVKIAGLEQQIAYLTGAFESVSGGASASSPPAQPPAQVVMPSPEPPSTPAPNGVRDIKYVTRERDTLSALARRFYGDRYLWRRIYDANHELIPNPDILPVGAVITIPDVPPQHQNEF